MAEWDIGNSLNWDLSLRVTKEVQSTGDSSYLPIPPVSVPMENPTIMVGISSSAAKPTWFLGCRASMRLLTLPSTTSEFTAIVEVASKPCGLGRLTLIRFPDLNLYPYLLLLTFPIWIQQAYVEVWKYSGPSTGIETEGIVEFIS